MTRLWPAILALAALTAGHMVLTAAQGVWTYQAENYGER
jgi:hypothetical protein